MRGLLQTWADWWTLTFDVHALVLSQSGPGYPRLSQSGKVFFFWNYGELGGEKWWFQHLVDFFEMKKLLGVKGGWKRKEMLKETVTSRISRVVDYH